MASKAQRRKQRKRNKSAIQPMVDAIRTEAESAPRSRDRPLRPTSQRLAHGKWNMPEGPGKREQPMTDVASDMIGRLYQEGRLTTSEEQAARRWQEVYAAYIASVGVAGYRSCLAGGSGAFDSGEGDMVAERTYHALRERIGRVKAAVLQIECEKLPHQKPGNLGVLVNALKVLARAS